MFKCYSKYYLFGFALFLSGFICGQENQRADSLYNIINWDTERPELIDQMLDEVVKFRETDDLATAKELLDTLFVLAENSDNVDFQKARIHIDAAIIARIESSDELMINHYQSAIEIYKNLEGNVHDSLQDKLVRSLSVCYNNSAQVFLNREEYDLALECYHNAVTSILPMNDSLAMSIGYYNLSNTLVLMEQYDSAMHYILLSKELEQGMNSPEGLSYAHEGIAKVYNGQENFIKALMHIDSAIYFTDFFGDEFFKLDVAAIKADIVDNIGGTAEAINVLEKGLVVARRIGYRSFELDSYSKLSELYDKSENSDKAYFYLKEFNKLNATIQQEKTQKRIEEFQVQYKTEQKDKEISNLALQNELTEKANNSLKAQQVAEQSKNKAEQSRNRVINWSLAGGVLLLGLIGVLLYSGSKRRERNNEVLKKSNEDLQTKNDQIEFQARQISDSIAYARNIQTAILPLKSELDESLSDHFVYYKPKDIVSGDFYWYHELKDQKKALIAVADCTGHGVPGAFMSIVGHALLEKIVKQLNITETDEILNQLGIELNNTLQKGGDDKVKDGMDIAIISIDRSNGKFDYSGARNHLIFSGNNELVEYKGDRIDLGKGNVNPKKFTRHSIPFKKGDSIYMFTDGYVDQKGGKNGKKFFMPPFRALLKEISLLNVQEQKVIIDNKFREWKGDNYSQMDDVLVMGIKL